MGLGKWITGAIGWALGGPLGGLVGYLLGSLFEGDQNGAQRVYTSGGGFSANHRMHDKSIQSCRFEQKSAEFTLELGL